jgi:hypothetical protein
VRTDELKWWGIRAMKWWKVRQMHISKFLHQAFLLSHIINVWIIWESELLDMSSLEAKLCWLWKQ